MTPTRTLTSLPVVLLLCLGWASFADDKPTPQSGEKKNMVQMSAKGVKRVDASPDGGTAAAPQQGTAH